MSLKVNKVALLAQLQGLKALTTNRAKLRLALKAVADPLVLLPRKQASSFARLVELDTGGQIKVLSDKDGCLVGRYTKEFAREELRDDPPHLIATEEGKLFVAKKVNPEAFIDHRDEEDVLLHPTDEATGTELLRQIGAPSYQVTRGKKYEYLEFLPGIDLLTAKRNGLTAELVKQPEQRVKLLFAIGVALAQAYLIGMRDRVGGLRLDVGALLTGEGAIARNIDLSSALDERVFQRGLHNFLASFAAGALFCCQPGTMMVLDQPVLDGFRHGFRQSVDYFRRNAGSASDAIRRLAGDKAGQVFARLEMTPEQLEPEIAAYVSWKPDW